MATPTPNQVIKAMRLAKAAGDDRALNQLRDLLLESYQEETRTNANPAAGMSMGELAKANLGAGMADLAMGAGQLVGLTDAEDAREKAQRDELLAQQLPYAGRGLQFAGATLPTLIPGAAAARYAPGLSAAFGGARGAAASGGLTGALLPTTNDDIWAGKVLNTGLGAAGGYGASRLTSAAAPAVSRGAGAARDWALRQGIGTSGARQRLAERSFVGAMGQSPQQASVNIARGLADELPGITPTTAQLTGDPAMLMAERALRETGGEAGAGLRATVVPNNQIRAQVMEQALNHDADLIKARKYQWATERKNQMKLMPGGIDPNGRFKAQFTYWENRFTSDAAKNLFRNLKKQYLEILDAPEARQLELLQKLRTIGIRDQLDAVYSSERGAAKLLRKPLTQLKRNLDNQVQRRLKGGDWHGFMRGYTKWSRLEDQVRAGKEIYDKTAGSLNTNLLSEGTENLMARRAELKRALSEPRSTNQFGDPTLQPSARAAAERVARSLDREARPYSADIAPKGSATAENLRMMKQLGVEHPELTAEDVYRGAIGAGLGLGMHPLAAVGGGLAGIGSRALSRRATQDIAQRLLTLYRSPQAALQALQRANAPPGLVQQVAQAFASVGAQASAPVATVGLGNSLLSSQ